jgi:hypothetical protein
VISCFVPVPVPGDPTRVYLDARTLDGVLRTRVNRFDFLEMMRHLVRAHADIYMGKAAVPGKNSEVHTFRAGQRIAEAAAEAFGELRKLDEAEDKGEARRQVRARRKAVGTSKKVDEPPHRPQEFVLGTGGPCGPDGHGPDPDAPRAVRPAHLEALLGPGPVEVLPAEPAVVPIEEHVPGREPSEVCRVIVSLIRLARSEGKIALAEENAIMEALTE